MLLRCLSRLQALRPALPEERGISSLSMMWFHWRLKTPMLQGNRRASKGSLKYRCSRNLMTKGSSTRPCCRRANRAVFGFRTWMKRHCMSYSRSFGNTRSRLVSWSISAGWSIALNPSNTKPAHKLQPQRIARHVEARMTHAGKTALHCPGSCACHFLSICQATDIKGRVPGCWSWTAVMAYTKRYRGKPEEKQWSP